MIETCSPRRGIDPSAVYQTPAYLLNYPSHIRIGEPRDRRGKGLDPTRRQRGRRRRNRQLGLLNSHGGDTRESRIGLARRHDMECAIRTLRSRIKAPVVYRSAGGFLHAPGDRGVGRPCDLSDERLCRALHHGDGIGCDRNAYERRSRRGSRRIS